MKTLIGGAIAVLLGIILIAIWFNAFLQLLAGAIPPILLLGGGLAIVLDFLDPTIARFEPAKSGPVTYVLPAPAVPALGEPSH